MTIIHTSDLPGGVILEGENVGSQVVTGADGSTLSTLTQRFGHVINVKDDYNAKGDGTTDDSAAIQAAINAAITAGEPVYVPKGTYILDPAGGGGAVSVDLTGQNFEMFGDGLHSIIKRIDNATPSDFEYLIQVNTATSGTDLIHIHDLYFDDNAANNPLTDPDVDAFEFEHNATIIIAPDTDDVIQKVLIENVYFSDPMSDCILFPSVSGGGGAVQTEVGIINNMTVFNRNRTRSDITVTGSLRRLIVSDFSGFRIENEYNNAQDGERFIQLSNCHCAGYTYTEPTTPTDHPGIDLGPGAETNYDLLKVDMVNCFSGIKTILGRCVVNATNSTFHTHESESRLFNRPGSRNTFKGCTFLLEYDATADTVEPLAFGYESPNTSESTVLLSGCHFQIDADDTVLNGDIAADQVAITVSTVVATSWTAIPRLIVERCTFDSRIQHCVYAHRMGYVELVDNIYTCQDYAIKFQTTNDAACYLIIKGGNYEDSGGFLDIASTQETEAENRIEIYNLFMDEDDAGFDTSSGASLNGAAFFYSNRIIYADSAPTATTTPGIRGDRWRLKAPAASQVNEWVAINTNKTGADWVPVAAVGAVLT